MRFLAAGLIVLPLSALALEPGEFHLYGINKAGLVFDMTPYQGGASGDPATARGFTSRFANWVKPGEATLIKPQRICTGRQTPDECLRWALMHPAGRCSV